MNAKDPSSCFDELEKAERQHQDFLAVLLEVGELSHTADDDSDFYQRLLQLAVDVVPGAEAGSILLSIDRTSTFRFVAAVGYDLEQLQRNTLDKGDFFRDAHSPGAEIVDTVDVDSRDPQVSSWLDQAGRLSEIQSNVSAPVIVDSSTVAFISLDSFSTRGAFGRPEREAVTVLSRFIGDLLVRRGLESQLRAEREAFRELASRDALTGLANRRNLEKRLSAAIEVASDRRGPSALLFLDLDDFKQVNDTLGHDFGDRVLCAVGRAINQSVRPDDVVCRWGGDEFVVLPALLHSPTEARRLAERIASGFTDALDLGDGESFQIGVSIGVGWCADGQLSGAELLAAADEALYEAKKDRELGVKVALSPPLVESAPAA